jgi:hypothetical protein
MRIGYYNDTYVRTPGGWRLRSRAMTFIAVTERTIPAARTHTDVPGHERVRRAGGETEHMNVAEFRAGVCAWLGDHDLCPGPDHSLDGQVAQRAATIYGGTAEIQRNIIARRLLRLGRD